MKILAFLAFLLLSVSESNAQWSLISNQNLSGFSYGTNVFFLNDTLGFSNTSKTIDGGVTWTPMFISPANSIFFTNTQLGYATRQQQQGMTMQTYERTFDGGDTWINMSAAYPSFFGSGTLDFPSLDTGYILRANEGLYKTLDAGDSWVNINDTIGSDDINFVHSQFGYTSGTVGNDAFIYRTQNGGSFWERFLIPVVTTTPSNLVFVKIYAINEQDVYAAISFFDDALVNIGVEILYSSDSGETWSSQFTGTDMKILDLEFSSSNNGYAVGKNNTIGQNEGLVLHTIDGINWSLEDIGYNSLINNSHFISDAEGWLAGSNGDILHFPGGNLYLDKNQTSPTSYTLFPNPSLNSATLQFSNPNNEVFNFTLLDSYGQIVDRITGITSDVVALERGNLASGMYIFKLESSDGRESISDRIILK